MTAVSTARDRPGAPVAPAVAERAELDEDGFEAFYRRTASGLWRYLCRITGDPAQADDVAQDAYLRFLARPGRRTDERGRRAYLYQIATNLCRDRWRRARREQGFLAGRLAELRARGRDALCAPGRDGDLAQDLGTAMTSLKPRERALVWLAYVEGHRHQEIAEILGVRPGSVRVLLHRARHKLAGLLTPSRPAPEESR